MKSTVRVAALLALAGLPLAASAQDSVSRFVTGLPGDGLSAWDVTEQKNTYVVDLVPFTTDFNSRFGIAPIVKSCNTDPAFFGSLVSAQAISQTTLVGVPFAASSYSFWSVAGEGIHPTNNNPPASIVMPTGLSNQQTVGFAEFSGNANNIIGAIVNINPNQPGRLFVTRTTTAVNYNSGAFSEAQVGFGAADASGWLVYRADESTAGVTAGPNNVASDRYYATDMVARTNGALNRLSNTGATLQATSVPYTTAVGGPETLVTPSVLPAELACHPSGNPFIGGASFTPQFIRGLVTGAAAGTNTHIDNNMGDSRGTPSFSPQRFMSGSVGTFAYLGKSIVPGGNGPSDGINMWDVDKNANVLRTSLLVRPAVINDNTDAFATGALWELDHYHSQVAFRGGNGQVGVGRDRQGRGLAAATMYDEGSIATDDNPLNAIVVARFSASNPEGTAAWAVAAWYDGATGTGGKPIRGDVGADGIPNTLDAGEGDGNFGNDTPAGRLAGLFELTGGTPLGPSISAPSIDANGDIWFVSNVALNKTFGIDFDTALLRARYNAATFGYDLELIVELGQVYTGANSATDWQVQFIDTADSNSVSSGNFWSANANGQAFNRTRVQGLPEHDSRGVGGVVLSANIVYDRDGDGDFEDPTGGGGVPSSDDESYQTLLYIGNLANATPCFADTATSSPNICGQPDGVVNTDDFICYLTQFGAGDCAADINGVAGLNTDDFIFYLGQFAIGCP